MRRHGSALVPAVADGSALCQARPGGLGQLLVTRLAAQLEATVSVDGGRGTTVTVTMPEPAGAR